MSTKQLYEKTSEGMKEVSPLVAIEDIYSKLSDTPLEALVSLYNHVKCEWKGSVADTRRTVPLFLRRSGLFITYNNGTKYITEFFSAGTDQITTEGWVKDSNWTPVPDEDYISDGVKPGFGTIGYEQLSDNLKQLFREKVNVTNFPDDEDIASVDNMLKLKDREADVENFQSKGYIILRKNLVEVNGVVKNILTQDMINQPNTIYEIRYDFDLNGETIEMQEGCTLKFEGGTLYNGKIKGNNTKVEANITRIFGEHFLLEGTFDVAEGYAEWFGAQSDGINDDRYSIQCAINSFDIVRLLNKGYLIDSLSDNINKIALIVPVGKSIRGSYNRQSYENDIVRTIRLGNNVVPKKIIGLAGKNYIGNIGISGNSKNNDTISQVGIGTVDDTSRIKLEMIAIDNTYYGIDICAWGTILTQCSCSYNTIGIRVKGIFNNSTLKTQETSTTLINCYVGSSLGYAYYINGMTYSALINCSADNCGWGIDKGTISDSTAKQIFAIRNCKSISFINCACEYGVKIAYITSSEHIVFDNCNFLLKSDGLENDFAYTKVIDFRYSNDVKFRNCIISGTDLSSKKWIYSENENKHKSLLNIVDCNFPFKKSLYFITSNVTFGYQESIESIAVLKTCNRSINSRFTPSPMDIGISYFDKSLNPPRPIWWTGEKWINADGTDI